MYTKFLSILSQRNLQVLALGTLCIVSSFTVGIKTAGDITPIKLIEAGSVDKPGDINGNGEIDIRDVIDILEISQGYRDATTEELRVDPNGDGALTVDDALWILSTLAIRSDAS